MRNWRAARGRPGCSGREKLGLPVVDGVGAAVKPAESLVALRLTTSRAGSCVKPLPYVRYGCHAYRTSGSRSSFPLPSVCSTATKP